mmetsp:Transcript_13205/g.21606  ORF Transcript_13205/g.21606 Transcript_13205/m.21606 type:complete len:81 (-) Transcript_13205:367-609(-)
MKAQSLQIYTGSSKQAKYALQDIAYLTPLDAPKQVATNITPETPDYPFSCITKALPDATLIHATTYILANATAFKDLYIS